MTSLSSLYYSVVPPKSVVTIPYSMGKNLAIGTASTGWNLIKKAGTFGKAAFAEGVSDLKWSGQLAGSAAKFAWDHKRVTAGVGLGLAAAAGAIYVGNFHQTILDSVTPLATQAVNYVVSNPTTVAATYVGAKGASKLARKTVKLAADHPKKAAAVGVGLAVGAGALYLTNNHHAVIDPLVSGAQKLYSGEAWKAGTKFVAENGPVAKNFLAKKGSDFLSHSMTQTAGKVAVPVALVALGARGGRIAAEKAAEYAQRHARDNFEARMDVLFQGFLIPSARDPNQRVFPAPLFNPPVDADGYALIAENQFPETKHAFVTVVGGYKVYGLRASGADGKIKFVSIQFVNNQISVVTNGYNGLPPQITQAQLNRLSLQQLANLGEANPNFALKSFTSETRFQKIMEETLLANERDLALGRLYPAMVNANPPLPVPPPAAPVPVPGPAPAGRAVLSVVPVPAPVLAPAPAIPPALLGAVARDANGYVIFDEENFPADKSVIVLNNGDAKIYGFRLQNVKDKVKFLAVQMSANGLVSVVAHNYRGLPPQLMLDQLARETPKTLGNIAKRLATANYKLTSRHESTALAEQKQTAALTLLKATANQRIRDIQTAVGGVRGINLPAQLVATIT